MLQKLLNELNSRKSDLFKDIFIPKVWNCLNLSHEEYEDGLVIVNEGAFLLQTIQSFYQDGDFDKALSSIDDTPWLKESIAYSMMIRTSTTFDYNNDGSISDDETGTFLKTIMLLPYLKQMGVTMLYLLPISKYSKKDKKGELGSVYGISNFLKLDPALKDKSSLTVEEEFACLIEAAHMMGIRVVIDIIPRTNSVESDLIKDHPDWFYWIKNDEIDNYKAPWITEIGASTQPHPKNLKYVYHSENTKRHLDMFVESPQNHPDWDKYKHDLDLVKKHLNVRVAPAFSDHINDPQPPWTDVTFFRLYKDHPVDSVQYLEKDYPPYILFDTIKGNLFQGNVKNEELWEVLSEIIPFYQSFGVDGARIDMGHALPKELTQMILDKAKSNDPEFIFIAEEMNPDNALHAKQLGYDLIIGNGFFMTPRYKEGYTKDYYTRIPTFDLPVFACGETHDTQRLAAREQGGKNLSRMLTVLNMFVPNAVPFINSGQELYETQPMNLGVDCKPDEDENLPKSDPFYKKLALFDKYQFHYTNSTDLIDILKEVNSIRHKYIKHINRGEFKVTDESGIMSFEFTLDDTLTVLANFGTETVEIEGELLFSTNKNKLAPSDIIIMKGRKEWRK